MDSPPSTSSCFNWNAQAYLGAVFALPLQAQDTGAHHRGGQRPATIHSPLLRDRFPDVQLIAVRCDQSQATAAATTWTGPVRRGDRGAGQPDIEAPPDWLSTLVAAMVADPDIGVAGCLLCDADGTVQHAGGLVYAPIALSDHLGRGASRMPDASRLAGGAAVADVDPRHRRGHGHPPRRAARIGGLDETFFLYYEDVDYCFRARAAGFRVVYVPTPPVIHHESVTTGKESQFYLRSCTPVAGASGQAHALRYLDHVHHGR
ncbi:MAG: hypothetical protein R3A10_10935 [Caldilineaceae bacterium]